MKRHRRRGGGLGSLAAVLILILLGRATSVDAQTFNSGSTGALGAFAPTANTTVTLPPDGVLHYTTISIPSGVTVSFAKNAANTPVTMLATGDVTIAGTLNLAGENGRNAIAGLSPNQPGEGGPGGFHGGFSGASNNSIPPGNGQGPGGGVYPGQFCSGFGCAPSGKAGAYGPPSSSSFVSLLPLFGGSGGSGTAVVSSSQTGHSGAGGGGAIVIASATKITLAAGSLITARGGSGFVQASGNSLCQMDGGAGSGGAIRLVAPHITGTGTLRASGGFSQCGEPGGTGRIRVEAFSFEGFAPTLDPTLSSSPSTFSQVTAPGPVAPTSNPALINLPTLAITSIGGVAPPAAPAGSYATADVSLPPGTSGSVAVTVAATNLPVGTILRVRVIPKNGPNSTVNSAPSTGDFNNSTATVTVSLPAGQAVVLTADATFTLPQLAGLLPLFDGEPVEQVLVAAGYGEPGGLAVVTRSGREVPLDRLPPEARQALALGWAIAMQTGGGETRE